MENNLIASKANCQLSVANHEYRYEKLFIHKLANVPSGIANAAQHSSRNMLHIPPSGG
jgi:hypothetical protein